MSDDLQELYNKQLEFTNQLCQDHKPMQVAAILLAQAMSMYKTALSADEYDAMVDTISASRGQVQTFDKVVLQ